MDLASPKEASSFEYLYNRYKSLMLQKANAILHDSMLAEDAVSEAFIRIYKNLHKIEDPDSAHTAAFIYTIVKNTALTLLSRASRQYTVFSDNYEQPDSFDLEQHVLSSMSAEKVLELMDGMNEELRSAFLLKYAYDLPHKQIGRLLGITENNVTVRLYRAKRQIAAILVKEEYFVE